MNNWTITGRIGQDAEIRYTSGGKAVCSISIAVDRRWKKAADGEKPQPLWVRVTFWDKFAESLAPHLLKGTVVAVSGEADLDEFESHGEKRTQIVIRSVRDFSFCGGSKKADSGQTAPASTTSAPAGPEIADEDITF